MWFSSILQEFFGKLKTHDSFPKIHMFIGTPRQRQTAQARGSSSSFSPAKSGLTIVWALPCPGALQPETGRVCEWSLHLHSITADKTESTSEHHIKTSTSDFYTLSPDIWRLFWGFFLMSILESGITASGCTLWGCFILSLLFALSFSSPLKAPEEESL